MKVIHGCLFFALLCAGCSDTVELGREASPDGTGLAKITAKTTHGAPLPGPEPPEIKSKSVRLTVTTKGKIVYDSGFQEIGRFQHLPMIADIAWAPDSSRVACRLVNSFCIVDEGGRRKDFPLVEPSDNSLISSFRWTGNRELLVVIKLIDDPLGMHGYPQHYHGYLAKSKCVRIARLNLDTGITNRFLLATASPTFMFHSCGFQNQEIAPDTNRVAFSAGYALCVYDDGLGRLVARVPVDGSIEGTWWDTNDRVIIGIGLLSGQLHFSRLDVRTGRMTDQTAQLLPFWTRNWERLDWFRPALPTTQAAGTGSTTGTK